MSKGLNEMMDGALGFSEGTSEESLIKKIEDSGYNVEDLEGFLKDDGDILGLSLAGAGKTSAIILKLIYDYQVGKMYKTKKIRGKEIETTLNVLVTTFSKSGANDLANTLQEETSRVKLDYINKNTRFSTLHSFYLDVIHSMNIKVNILNTETQYKLIRNVCKTFNIANGYPTNMDIQAIIGAISYIANRIDYKTDDEAKERMYQKILANSTLERLNIVSADFVESISKAYQQEKKQLNLSDFDDLQKLLYDYAVNKETRNDDVARFLASKFDYIVIDEFQDVSQIQYAILKVMALGKTTVIAVGDDDQCQPKGTKVLMDNYQYKNIEDIKVGDKVTCYRKTTRCDVSKPSYGEEVLKVASHVERGILEVTTESDFSSKYTKGHHCYASLVGDVGDKYALYLMRNEKNHFRIGITKFFRNESSHVVLGIRHRMRQEKCVDGWILNVYDTKQEAWVEEQLYSVKYGIPQLVFDQKISSITEEDLENFYSKLENLEENVNSLLKHFNKDIKYPLVVKNGKSSGNHLSRASMFEIRACNILPKVMELYVFEDDVLKVSTVKSVTYSDEEQEVYSLEIDKHHNYFADRILTHNCIYGFRGSDVDIILNKYPEDFNPTIHKFTYSYRCPKNVLNIAKNVIRNNKNRYEKEMKAFKDGGDVKAISFNNYSEMADGIANEVVKDLAEGKTVTVLAGTNFDLQPLAVALDLKNQTSFRIGGTLFELTRAKYSNIYNILSLLDVSERFGDVVNKGFYTGLNRFKVNTLAKELVLRNMRPLDYPLTEYYKVDEKLGNAMKLFIESYQNSVNNSLSVADAMIDLLYAYRNAMAQELVRNKKDLDVVMNTLIMILKSYENDINSYEDFITVLKKVNQHLVGYAEARKENLILTTIHDYKGLEADSIYLFNMVEGSLPRQAVLEIPDLKVMEDEIEEERRLAYIGITRSAEKLTLCTHYGDKAKPSRFLTETGLTVEPYISTGSTINLKKKKEKELFSEFEEMDIDFENLV